MTDARIPDRRPVPCRPGARCPRRGSRGACARAGRDPADVTLVAVSKTIRRALRDAVAAGLDLLGENRVQEAVAKVPQVPGARWHLVGPLQSNKARPAVEVFDAIESVDSIEACPEARSPHPRGRDPAVAIRSWSRSTWTRSGQGRISAADTVDGGDGGDPRAVASRRARDDDRRAVRDRPRPGPARRSLGLRELSERCRSAGLSSVRSCRWG